MYTYRPRRGRQPGSGFMDLKKLLLGCACVAALFSVSGCVAVTVASTAVTVASTAVSVGLTAGSVAVGAATTVAKGAVIVGDAVIGDDDDADD